MRCRKRLSQLEQRLRESEDALQAQDKQALEAAAALREAHDKQALEAAAALREAQAALQAANAKLAAESATDCLTGLPNRRTFSRRSEQAASALRHVAQALRAHSARPRQFQAHQRRIRP